ncbi:hypothetical protein KMI9_195 [Klebsiella phage KMI9]|jgi:hypothetical protein|uniref:Uncharacterized protein n=6 Tax=Slopekvirus TaxID=1985328 RepID=A0A6H0X262_9CAUD|nr:hypothetical protein KP27_138 [Klebsiella phage KP27]YP_009194368.1 hypothetical protein CPT_Matisse124 [Klebsiella phage Matisse]YP_009626361.1 Phage protein [Klebsiella phage PMBT1]YP_010089042.1 hypothetical protein KNT56_gp217 [Escherichia phage phT4A]MBG2194760.1 hypothetical protein [Klebsiella pneumoniae]QEG10626.1 hypothetical protein KMI9_195 [Klebsiella phage KMI9]QIW86221.1 hypothetical protein PKP2_169 [Klebsiella phage P-KP2]QQO91524.1 hypothetical protein vBKpnMM1_gp125c [Kl
MSDVILNVKDVVLGDTKTLDSAMEKAVVKIMRNSLRLEVNEITETCYTGGLCGQSLYRDAKSVNIQLWADIGEESYKIDEVDFDV